MRNKDLLGSKYITKNDKQLEIALTLIKAVELSLLPTNL